MSRYDFPATIFVSSDSIGDDTSSGIDDTVLAAVGVSVTVEDNGGRQLQPLDRATGNPTSLTTSDKGFIRPFYIESDEPVFYIYFRAGELRSTRHLSNQAFDFLSKVPDVLQNVSDLQEQVRNIDTTKATSFLDYPGKASVPMKFALTTDDVTPPTYPIGSVVIVAKTSA